MGDYGIETDFFWGYLLSAKKILSDEIPLDAFRGLLYPMILALVFAAVFVITFSPWGFHCLSEKGPFFYNENYKNIAYEVYGKGKISWDDFWFKESSKINSLTEVIFKDTGLFFSTVIGNVTDHILSDMEKLLGWQISVFVILGLVLLIISNPFKN